MTWNWCGNTPTINPAVPTANTPPLAVAKTRGLLACLCQIQNAAWNGAQQKKRVKVVCSRGAKRSGADLNRTGSGNSPRRQSVTFRNAQRQRKRYKSGDAFGIGTERMSDSRNN